MAELGRAHGLRGEIQARLAGLTGPELLEIPRLTLRRPDGRETPVAVLGARAKGPSWILEIDVLDDRTSAEAHRNSVLLAFREDLPPPELDEWYVQDLVGLPVVTEEGKALGVVEEVLKLPANDVFVVRGDGREILLPLIDDVVREVDLEAKRIVARLLPGMLEEGGSEGESGEDP